MSHLDNNLLPVQSDIHTFLVKKLWRLEPLFPRDCKEKLILNAGKWVTVLANAVIVRGLWQVRRGFNLRISSNISNLVLTHMRTFADKFNR